MIIILPLDSVIFYTAVDSTEKTYENSVQVCGWTVRFIAAADANARITLLRNFKIYICYFRGTFLFGPLLWWYNGVKCRLLIRL